MKILDGFCRAGGSSWGYRRRGHHVTGVDIEDQPNYKGDEFIQGDAVEYIANHGHKYDLIHAGPPCQFDCTLTAGTNAGLYVYPDLLEPTREALIATGRPYVIEQPQGKASKRMRVDLRLCGEMFGLEVIRHRIFEFGLWSMEQPKHIKHRGLIRGYNHGRYQEGYYYQVYGDGGGKGSVEDWQRAMGIDWMWDKKDLAEAIPPAYTDYICEAFETIAHHF